MGNAPVYLRESSGTLAVEGSAYDGIGSSLEVEPPGDLDGNTFGLKGEVSRKLPPE